MQLKFAMLEILAGRPEGCASIEDLWHEWEQAGQSQDARGRFSEFEGVDLLQAGLVVLEGDRLHIADAGRSVLRALDTLSQQVGEAGRPDQSQTLKAIDDLIGAELRTNIFDLRLRAPGEISDLAPLDEEQAIGPEVAETETDADVDDEVEATAARTGYETAEIRDHDRYAEVDAPAIDLPSAPGFFKRDSGPRIPTPAGLAPRTWKLPAVLFSQFERFSLILRRHVAEGSTRIEAAGRTAGVRGAIITALIMIAILVGAGFFIGVNQIKNLKSEITALERQLGPLKKQVADADQKEKKNNAEQTSQLQNQALFTGAIEKSKNPEQSKSPLDDRPTPTALALSLDEVRLIREYIKPAPFTGPAAPAINVGDPVSIATIPLPSPLTDKVPKLLGGRFTIRNGSIVIIKRNSHQADAVLMPN